MRFIASCLIPFCGMCLAAIAISSTDDKHVITVTGYTDCAGQCPSANFSATVCSVKLVLLYRERQVENLVKSELTVVKIMYVQGSELCFTHSSENHSCDER
jgi:hypothetical protein